MEPYFELDDVSVAAVGNSGAGRDILSGISWKVEPESRWSVVGPSGAGKSTLLRLLNRMADPSRGRIRRRGEPLEEIAPGRLRREVAQVFQEPVWLFATVRENLLAPVRFGLVPAEDAEARLPRTLELAGLGPEHLNRGEDELSVGQRQRVVLARALMTRPEVLLLDEPTSALDPPGARALLEQVLELGRTENLTLIMVTHRLGEARQFGTHAAVLEDGRLTDQGPSAETLSRLEKKWEDS